MSDLRRAARPSFQGLGRESRTLFSDAQPRLRPPPPREWQTSSWGTGISWGAPIFWVCMGLSDGMWILILCSKHPRGGEMEDWSSAALYDRFSRLAPTDLLTAFLSW